MAEIFEEFNKDLSNWTTVKNSITRSILDGKMRITSSTTQSSGWIESSMKWNAVNFLEHKNFSLEFEISISNDNPKSFGIVTIDLVDETSKNLASVEFYDNSGSDTTFPISEFRINGARSRFSVPRTNVNAKYKMDYKNGVMVIYQNDIEMFSGEVEGISHLLLRVQRLGVDPWFKYVDFDYFRFKSSVDKSLVLHNGEYKTITPEIPYSPPILGAKVAVVPNMTSNTAPSGLVFASSFEGGREPWRAFNNNNAGLTYTFKTPNYKADGEFIGYIFTEAQKISSYAIYPVNIGPLYGWDFQISNDTTDGSNGTWTTVDTKRNQNMTQSLMHYDLSNEVAAKAFRIVTRPAIGAGNLISSWLRQIQIYKKEILSPEIPAQPMKIVTVSTAIPTIDQFMEHGMEQLSPLLDRVTKESDRIPMNKMDL